MTSTNPRSTRWNRPVLRLLAVLAVGATLATACASDDEPEAQIVDDLAGGASADATDGQVRDAAGSASAEVRSNGDGRYRIVGLGLEPNSSMRVTLRRDGTFVTNYFGIAAGDGSVNTSSLVLTTDQLQDGDRLIIGERRRDASGTYEDPDWITFLDIASFEAFDLAPPLPTDQATLTVVDKPAGEDDRANISGMVEGQFNRVVVTRPEVGEVFERTCDPADADGFETCPIGTILPGDTVQLSLYNGSSYIEANTLVVPTDVLPGETATDQDGDVFVFEMPPCAPVPSGMLAWWRGNGDATDQLGVSDATLHEEATTESGGGREYFAFDGVDAYAEVLHNAVVDVRSEALTMEAWVFLDTVKTDDAMIIATKDRDGALTERAYNLFVDQNEPRLGFLVQTAPSGPAVVLYSDRNLPIQQWVHVAGVYDGSQLTVYIDGEDVSDPSAERAQSGPIISRPSTPLSIGRWRGSFASGYLAGAIDELSLYEEAATQAELRAIYVAGTSGKCTS